VARPELWLFSGRRWGRRFRQAAVCECAELGLDLTIVVGDPVRSAGTLTQLAIRSTRPYRRRRDQRRLRTAVRYVEDVSSDRFRGQIHPEVHGVITGYPQIFDAFAIERFASFVNVHPSVLPHYPGPDPVGACLEAGETHSGWTIHEVTEAVDAGPILRQDVVAIAGASDPLDLIASAAIPAFVEYIRAIAIGQPYPVRGIDSNGVYHVRSGGSGDD
jgi:hypothetical protein